MRSWVAALALFVSCGAAFGGEDMPDREFAKFPIIVVARWTGQPLVTKERLEEGVVVGHESRTTIVVDRVLRGDITPTKHKILLKDQLHFGKEAHSVWLKPLPHEGSTRETIEFTSTHSKRLAEANIWFLYRGRSWDRSDKHRYLILDRVTAIQHVAVEPFVRALLRENPGDAVAELFRHENQHVALRALRYQTGGRMPWPEISWAGDSRDADWRPRKPTAHYVSHVRTATEDRDFQVRAPALAILAALEGDAVIPRARGMLKDAWEVSVTAMGVLASFRDEASLPAMDHAARTVVSRQGGTYALAAELARRLARWDDDRVIPMLIALLYNMEHESRPDFPSPSVILAQDILRERTDFLFPLHHVEKSLAAWDEAASLKPAARGKLLAKRLGERAHVHAELVSDVRHETNGFFIQIENRGKQPVSILREPIGYSYHNDNLEFFRPWRQPKSAADLLTLRPGERMQTDLPMPVSWLRTFRASAELFLRYTKPEKYLGVDHFIGAVRVHLPPLDKLIRKASPAEELKVHATVHKLLLHARGRRYRSAAKLISYTSQWEHGSWMFSEEHRQSSHVQVVCGILRAALESGRPVIDRVEVYGGKATKNRGPITLVKVLFGEGPAQDAVLLVCRKIGGQVLIGRALLY